jgi:hypothetical protein
MYFSNLCTHYIIENKKDVSKKLRKKSLLECLRTLFKKHKKTGS